MSKAQLCPVCSGKGKVKLHPERSLTIEEPELMSCYGCMGRGWVSVSN